MPGKFWKDDINGIPDSRPIRTPWGYGIAIALWIACALVLLLGLVKDWLARRVCSRRPS